MEEAPVSPLPAWPPQPEAAAPVPVAQESLTPPLASPLATEADALRREPHLAPAEPAPIPAPMSAAAPLTVAPDIVQEDGEEDRLPTEALPEVAPTDEAPGDAPLESEEALLEADPAPLTEEGPVIGPAALEPPEPLAASDDPILPRDTTSIPGYNRWAETPLGTGSQPLAAPDAPHRPRWPFILAALALSLLLIGQVVHRFRTDITIALPGLAPLFTQVGWTVPLPRKAELVAIDDSDLQSDAAHNRLILSATVHNRAPYDQALPALELALTDTRDSIIARRVLQAADYLPEKDSQGRPRPSRFAANGELPVHLWLDGTNLGAAGYRLYVFYP